MPNATNCGVNLVLAFELDRNGNVSKKTMKLDREAQLTNSLLQGLYPGIHVATVDVPTEPLDSCEQAMVEQALTRIEIDGIRYSLVGASGSAKNGKFYAVESSFDAQAFKRACSCFGLGRYFYDIQAVWVDLDQNRQPVRTPALFAWALPENWRKGMRPSGRNGNGSAAAASNSANGRSQTNGSGSPRLSDNGHTHAGDSKGRASGANGDDLDARILCLERTVGTVLYRNILRECGRANQPKLIRDPAVKRTVLQMLESAARGFTRLEAVTKRLDAKTVEALLAKLQAPPLGEISDMKTLQHVVFGLEELAGSDQQHAA